MVASAAVSRSVTSLRCNNAQEMCVIPSSVSIWKPISRYFLIFAPKLKEPLSRKQQNWRTEIISDVLIAWNI
jgi:hypothetical protein